MNDRQKQILLLLCNQKGQTTFQLAKSCHVSVRTIQNDLNSLKSELSVNNIYIIKENGKYQIPYELIDCVHDIVTNKLHYLTNKIPTSVKDRQIFILISLLKYTELNINEICNKIYVSNVTIYSDIKIINSKILMSKLQLENEKGKLILKGNESYKRKLLCKIFATRENRKIINKYLAYYLEDNITACQNIYYKIFNYFPNRDFQFSNGEMYCIFLDFLICYIRNNEGYVLEGHTNQQISYIIDDIFGQLYDEFGYNFRHEDGVYLTYRLKHRVNLKSNNNISQLLIEYNRALVNQFDIDLSTNTELYQMLNLHLINYVNKIKENEYIVESDTDIIDKIPNLDSFYSISSAIQPIIYKFHNFYMDDNELKYLSLYIATFIRNLFDIKVSLILYGNCLSVIQYVQSKLNMVFKDRVHIINCISFKEVEYYSKIHNVDLICMLTNKFHLETNVKTYYVDILNVEELIYKIANISSAKEIEAIKNAF